MGISEQIAAVQSTMYPIVLIMLSKDYQLKTESYNYFVMSKAEEEMIIKTFPPFSYLLSGFHTVGKAVKEMDMDDMEIAFLCSIHLMNEGECRICNRWS